MNKKKALLIVNVGTPDSPNKKDVRRYLREFLNDRRVIDIPWLLQKILVNLIIIPFRTGKSAKLYKKLWTKNGSPLLYYLYNLSIKLQQKLNGKYTVYKAMRYGNPDLIKTLEQIKKDNAEEIVLLPLFPQYASSTSGSIIDEVLKRIRKWETIPKLRIINQFYNHQSYINAFVKTIKQYDIKDYDHVIFSYHGLPIRHIDKVHPNIKCENCTCEKEMPLHGSLCYKAACYETTRLALKDLQIPENKYSISFQSRLSKNWLAPFTDELIIELARKGAKKVLITAPSFVADCLETTIELRYEYNLLFQQYGGEQLTLVESLNDSDEWTEAIADIITTDHVCLAK